MTIVLKKLESRVVPKLSQMQRIGYFSSRKAL
jgi:hypothetical protein